MHSHPFHGAALNLYWSDDLLIPVFLVARFHVQIDLFDSDVTIWSIAAKCFLLFHEILGTALWQETTFTSEDFFDNLLDIYQSTDISRAKEQNYRIAKPQ